MHPYANITARFMLYLVLVGVLIVLFLAWTANAADPPPVHTSCHAYSTGSILDAKTGKPRLTWAASCSATVGDKSVLKDIKLVLPVNATRIEALTEIDRWMREDEPVLLKKRGIRVAGEKETSHE